MMPLPPIRSFDSNDSEIEDGSLSISRSTAYTEMSERSGIQPSSSRHKLRPFLRSVSMHQTGVATEKLEILTSLVGDLPRIERRRSFEEMLGGRTTFRCRLGLCSNELEVMRKEDSTVLEHLTKMVRAVQELTDQVGSCLPPEVAAELSESFRAKLNFPNTSSIARNNHGADWVETTIVEETRMSGLPEEPPAHLCQGHKALMEQITPPLPGLSLGKGGSPCHQPISSRRSAGSVGSKASNTSLSNGEEGAKRKRSFFGGSRDKPGVRSGQTDTPDSGKESRSLMSKFFRRSSNASGKAEPLACSPYVASRNRASVDSLGEGNNFDSVVHLNSLSCQSSVEGYDRPCPSLSPRDSVSRNHSQTSMRSSGGIGNLLMKLPSFSGSEKAVSPTSSGTFYDAHRDSLTLMRTGSDRSTLKPAKAGVDSHIVKLADRLTDTAPDDIKRSSSFSLKKDKPVLRKYFGSSSSSSSSSQRKRAGTTPSSMRSMQQRAKAKIKNDAAAS